MSEKFSLKWNDFHSNVSKAFGLFRNEDFLHDVTLVGDDHKQISTNKLVLSASSAYFKDILKNNKHSNPYLCLDGININDLNNILDYIYNGEVQIYQDDLDRFLGVAQRLKLQGLLADSKNEINTELKIQTGEHFTNEKDSLDSREIRLVEAKQESQMYSNVTDGEESVVAVPVNYDNIDEKLNEYLEKCSSGVYKCKLCGKTSGLKNAKQNIRFHIETHMKGLSFSCPICQKSFRSRKKLNNHKYYPNSHKN